MLCISAAIAGMRCLSVRLSVTFMSCAKTKMSSNFFHHWVAKPFWFFHTKRGGAIPTGTPVTGASNTRGYEKRRFPSNISLYLRNGYSWVGTCSETICKHRILFPSIQHLAWLPQGRSQVKQKCGKIAIFGLTHWLKHRITRKLLNIDGYMLRWVWKALNCLSIHATYCVIIAGASPGETKINKCKKLVPCGTDGRLLLNA